MEVEGKEEIEALRKKLTNKEWKIWEKCYAFMNFWLPHLFPVPRNRKKMTGWRFWFTLFSMWLLIFAVAGMAYHINGQRMDTKNCLEMLESGESLYSINVSNYCQEYYCSGKFVAEGYYVSNSTRQEK